MPRPHGTPAYFLFVEALGFIFACETFDFLRCFDLAGAVVVVAATAGAAMTLSATAEAISRFMSSKLRISGLHIEPSLRITGRASQTAVRLIKTCS